MEIKVVIPSHKRHDHVLTHKCIANAKICVPKSQAALYKEYNPDAELVIHPDSLKGLGRKRIWIYKKFGDVFLPDDDVSAFRRLWVAPESFTPHKLSPKDAYDLVQSTGNAAKEMGCHLFGFNPTPDNRIYSPLRPFRLSGFVRGSTIGLLKGWEVDVPPEADLAEDFFFSAMNAHDNRFCFVDLRVGLTFNLTWQNPGGLAEYRTFENERAATQLLKEYFGDVVTHRPDKTKGLKQGVSADWHRIMAVPF